MESSEPSVIWEKGRKKEKKMSEVRKQQHKFSSKKDDKAAQRRNVNVQVTIPLLL